MYARVQADRDTAHVAAVTRTLGWGDEAAERGSYADALAWLDTVEAIGDTLPEEYQAKRQAWRAALRSERAAR